MCGLPPSRVPLCTQVVISPVFQLCRLVSGIPPSVDCTVEENASRLCDDGLFCLPRSISIKSVPRGDSPAYTDAIRLHQCSCRCWMSVLPWCSPEPPIGRWCPPNIDSSVNAENGSDVPRLLSQLCWKRLLCASGLDVQPHTQEGFFLCAANGWPLCCVRSPRRACHPTLQHRCAKGALQTSQLHWWPDAARGSSIFFACAALVCKPMLMHLRFFREKNSTFFTVVHCSGPQILPAGFEF